MHPSFDVSLLGTGGAFRSQALQLTSLLLCFIDSFFLFWYFKCANNHLTKKVNPLATSASAAVGFLVLICSVFWHEDLHLAPRAAPQCCPSAAKGSWRCRFLRWEGLNPHSDIALGILACSRVLGMQTHPPLLHPSADSCPCFPG